MDAGESDSFKGKLKNLFARRRQLLPVQNSCESENESLINAESRGREEAAGYGAVVTGQVSESTTSGYASSSRLNDEHSGSNVRSSNGTSWYVSVFLVVNAALGAGLLNFPHAFHAAGGVETALTVQTILLVIACATLIILAYCADANHSPTYQDVILACLGPKFHILCSTVIVLYCYGTCITFLIIIGDQWDRFFWSYNTKFCNYFYLNRPFTITVSSVVFILPLCYPKRIDFLKYVSTAGVAAIVYIDFLQVYKYYTGEYSHDTGKIKHGPTHWSDVFLVAPTIFFGYQCHISSVPIYFCLKDRSTKQFLKTALTAMLVCMATYSVAAVYGYWTFGGNVSDDILQNYNAKDPWVLAAMIAMAAKTYTTYPLLLFCGRTGVDSLWIKCLGIPPSEQDVGERRRRVVQATLWFATSAVCAVFIPGIDSVISVLGALASTFIVVFPGLCLLEVVLTKQSKLQSERVMTAIQNSSSSLGPSSASVSISEPKASSLVLWLFFFFGCFLVVFGMFIFGIIVVNSFMGRVTKEPLCTID